MEIGIEVMTGTPISKEDWEILKANPKMPIWGNIKLYFTVYELYDKDNNRASFIHLYAIDGTKKNQKYNVENAVHEFLDYNREHCYNGREAGYDGKFSKYAGLKNGDIGTFSSFRTAIRTYKQVRYEERYIEHFGWFCEIIEISRANLREPWKLCEEYCKKFYKEYISGKYENCPRNRYLTLKERQERKEKRWISEYTMYSYVKELYPDAIHHYFPEYLHGQEFDCFIPSLNLGIEYQGKQHFEYVPFFHRNGEEDFLKQIERDNKKKQNADKAGVGLIYVNYNEDLTKLNISRKIQDYIKEKGEMTYT